MQKKIIAAAIIGMVSVGASAATVYDKDGLKVSLGGKFDFAVTYKDTEGKQTTTLQDGAYSTSRMTLGAEQAINSDLSAYLGYDMRFSDVYTGKNSDCSGVVDSKDATKVNVTCGGGGVTSNDAMKGGLLSKKFGRIEAGTINTANQQFSLAKKPYVNAQESELVKYGVSQNNTALSNRTVYMHTTTQLPVILKGSYSFSNNQITDKNYKTDATGKEIPGTNKKATALAAGFEFSVMNKMVEGGFTQLVKKSDSYIVNNRVDHNEGFIAVAKDGKKLSFHLANDKDHLAGTKGRGFTVNAYYLIGSKWDLGASYSKYKDRSEGAGVGKSDSGNGYMLGLHYYAAKGVAFFVGSQFQNWDRQDNKGKIAIVDGTKDNFLGSKSFKDTRSYTTGFNFAF